MPKNDGPAGENHPRFSFIIVSYNTQALTRAAVSSIVKYCSQFPHEIIVVDNRSADGTVEALRREFPGVKIITLEENRGYSTAANAGGKIARADWLITLNSDAELLPDTMTAVDDLMRRHPEVDVLGGQLIFPDGSLQTSVGFNRRNSGFDKYGQHAELVEVDSLVAAFMLTRREVWRRLNGMDEELFFYGEDADYCDRAIKSGAMLRFSPNFRVIHHRSGSSKGVNLRAAVEFWVSLRHLWRKNNMPKLEYASRIALYGIQLFFRVIWYFTISVLTIFLVRSQTVRLRKNFYLLKWHLCGCPAGWGLRPVKTSQQEQPA